MPVAKLVGCKWQKKLLETTKKPHDYEGGNAPNRQVGSTHFCGVLKIGYTFYEATELFLYKYMYQKYLFFSYI